jgi:hypothetical protein
MKLFSKAFLVAVFILILIELVNRVFFVDFFTGRFEYGYNPTSGIEDNGGGIVKIKTTGSKHFWNQSFENPKPSGRIRVFTIGDSIARGPKKEEAYPYYLGELLRKQGINADSINFSVPGFGSRRKQIVLTQALHYKPDVVILHLNHTNEFSDTRDWRRAQEFASMHPRNWFMKSYFLARLYEFKTDKVFWKLPQEIRAVRGVNDIDARLMAENNEAVTREWNETFHTKSIEIINKLRAEGIPVIIVTYCSIDRQHNGLLSDAGQDSWIRSIMAPGIYLVSPKDILSTPQRDSYFYADTVHWHPVGHRQMAAALASVIKQAIEFRDSQAALKIEPKNL